RSDRGRLPDQLGSQPLPGEAGVSLAEGDGLDPGRTELAVLDALRIDADLGEHRVDDRAPGDREDGDRLPGELLRARDLALPRQDEVEDLCRVLLPHRADGDTCIDRWGR